MKMPVWKIHRSVLSLSSVLICLSILPTCIQGMNCTSNSTTIISQFAKTYPDILIFTSTQAGKLVNMTCGMNITAPSDKILAFQFIYSSWSGMNHTCVPEEYVEIFDGSSASSRSIYKECKGSSLYSTLFTSGPNGYIELRTGVNPYRTSVFIRIVAVKPQVCTGVMDLQALPSTIQNLTSPYQEYGLNYPPDTNCSWRITAPQNHLIVIQGDSSVNCDGNDSLEIYDSESSAAGQKLGSLCVSTGKPYKTFYSTGREVLITFQSNVTFKEQSKKQRYFVLYYQSFQPDCRGGETTLLNATSITKTITSPKSPVSNNYPSNSNCSWRITAPPDHVIKLEAESKVMCVRNDHLKIYDSDTDDVEVLLGSPCYLSSNAVFYSTGNHVYISFTSDVLQQSSLDRYFNIRYSAFKPGTSCSTSNTPEQNKNIIIRGPTTGIIQSPNFPNAFPNNLDCAWKLHAPPNHVVKLYFDTVDLKASSCLLSDLKLKVQDGYYGSEIPILDYVRCYSSGSIFRESFSSVSSGRRLGLVFESGSIPIVGRGFNVNFTMQPIVTIGTCGEGREGRINLNGQASSIKTPGFSLYPTTKHPKNMTCVWSITVDQGYVIKMKINDNRLSKGCDSGEYARFIDGNTLNGPEMFTLCKNNKPVTGYSTGNNMLIEFKTSSAEDRGHGFFVSYMAVRKAPYLYSCSRNSAISSKNLTLKLASFDYPLSYPNNAFCRWMYKAPFGNRARLTITKLELQDSGGCEADYVSVSGSDYYSSPKLGRFCGKPKTPIVITSSGDSLKVDFRSDWKDRYPGFEGILEAIRDDSLGSCRVQGSDNFIPLNGSSGSFSSPRYPNYIPERMSCIWQITVPKEGHIKLLIKNLNVDYSCSSSSLEVRDGPPQEPTSKVIGRYCGRNEVPSIFSPGNYLWVHLKTEKYSSYYRGFTATYTTVSTLPLSISCRNPNQQKIKSASGQIATYNYPLKYDNNVSCQWYITVDSSKRIKLTFDTFSLEDSSGCKGDHVALYDGYFGELLGKYCGETTPDPVYSSGSTLYIKFATDGKGRYQGFKASFEAVLSVRTIILIVTCTLVGVGLILSLIGWCLKGKCLGVCAPSSQPSPADGTSVAGSNFQLTSRM